MDLSGNDNS